MTTSCDQPLLTGQLPLPQHKLHSTRPAMFQSKTSRGSWRRRVIHSYSSHSPPVKHTHTHTHTPATSLRAAALTAGFLNLPLPRHFTQSKFPPITRKAYYRKSCLLRKWLKLPASPATSVSKSPTAGSCAASVRQ